MEVKVFFNDYLVLVVMQSILVVALMLRYIRALNEGMNSTSLGLERAFSPKILH